MTVIDPTTQIGQLRLALGDFRDIPMLPDSVYQNALDSNGGSLSAAKKLCGSYILASLAFDSDAKLGIISTYGSQVFSQYKDFLLLVLKDPSFGGAPCPIPYVAGADVLHPILRFERDFKNAEQRPTSDERLHYIATQPFDPFCHVPNLDPLLNANLAGEND